MSSDEREILVEYARQRVVEAAIAYAAGTYPDDDPLDIELRAAIAALARLTSDE